MFAANNFPLRFWHIKGHLVQGVVWNGFFGNDYLVVNPCKTIQILYCKTLSLGFCTKSRCWKQKTPQFGEIVALPAWNYTTILSQPFGCFGIKLRCHQTYFCETKHLWSLGLAISMGTLWVYNFCTNPKFGKRCLESSCIHAICNGVLNKLILKDPPFPTPLT